LIVVRKAAAGFMFVQLIIVAIIVAILVVSAVPLYKLQLKRAMISEALTGVGAVRSAEQVYYSAYGRYLPFGSGDISNQPTDALPGLGLDLGESIYFDGPCFCATLDGIYGFVVTADGGASTALHAEKVREIIVQMRGNGLIRYSYDGGKSWTKWR